MIIASPRLRPHTVDANTVALWNFDQGLTDSSGNGLTLETVVGAECYADLGGGMMGGAFNTTRYWRRVGGANSAALNLVGNMTIEAVVRVLTQPTGLGTGVIVGYGAVGETGGNDNVLWQLAYGDATIGGAPATAGICSSSFFYEHSAGTNVTSTSPSFLVPVHETHHIALVRSANGATLTWYLNGRSQGQVTGLTPGTLGGAPAQFVTVGADKDAANGINAIVSSIRISNVARTAAEVMKSFQQCFGIRP
jgi:hypothetical protein